MAISTGGLPTKNGRNSSGHAEGFFKKRENKSLSFMHGSSSMEQAHSHTRHAELIKKVLDVDGEGRLPRISCPTNTESFERFTQPWRRGR